MELKIYDKSNNLRLTASPNSSSSVTEEIGGECSVSASFTHTAYVPLDVDDYIELEGVRYKVKSRYRPKQKNTQTYEYSVKFYAPIHDSEDTLMIFQEGGTTSEFSYDGGPREHLQLWIDNMNRRAGGNLWSIGTVITAENKTIDYRNVKCWDAAFGSNGIVATFGTEMWADGYVINLCKAERGEVVELGYLQGLTNLSQEDNGEVKFFTRLFPLGSTRNIDATKYGYSRLQLPDRSLYVDKNVDLYGVKEDTEENAFSAIYPKYVGTVSSVRTEEKTSEEGREYTVYYFKDNGMNWNPKDYDIPDLDYMLQFQTGELAGRGTDGSFQAAWHEETGEWEIINVYPDDTTQIPGGAIIPQPGDQYIPWNFAMPQEYITAAEQEYKLAVDNFLDTYSFDPNKYTGTTDRNYIEKNNTPLRIGWNVRLLSEQYFGATGGYKDTRITKVQRKLNDLCQATITCSDQVGTGWKSSVDNSLNSLRYEVARQAEQTMIDIIRTTDSKTPSDNNVFSALKALNTFLSKNRPDSTQYLLSLLGGVLIKKLARFGDFVTGISGGMIDENGDLEMESGYFRKRLFVPELAYNRITYFKGRAVLSPGGGCKVKSYVKNEDGSYTVTPDLTDADALSQFKDDILSAFFTTKNAEGKLTGFAQMQFRVTETDYDAKTFKMVNKPGETYEPGEEMVLAQTGNFSDEERQTYILFDTINGNNCITFFDKANTWDPEPAQMPAWFGKKKGMKIAGIDCDNYSAVLQNILMTGLIFQIDEITGDSVRVPIDKGEWIKDTNYGYYNRVSHNGALWLCVSEESTKEEPGTGNAWLKQVSEGAKGDPGLSVIGGGHWESSKTPYQANTLVSFYNCVFISNKETSNPPIAIARYKDGSFIRQKNGGYILAGKSADFTVHPDWTMLLDGRELQGKSITFLGSLSTAPSNPSEGNSYYNTTDKCTYVYQNGVWMLMVSDGKDGRDYEYIYTRNNSIGIIPDKPDSKQQDDYVPEGWTDNFLGVSETFQVEWGCKRTKRDGVWSEWSDPAPIYRWSKDGENGKDGISIEAVGHWESSKVPYTKNQLVNFSSGTFVALKETSNPPLPIARYKDGTYMRMKDGGYILAGKSTDVQVNEDWRIMTWTDAPETLYWLDCPISVFSFTSTGSSSPSSVEVTCKKSYRDSVSDCVTLWLVARRYNGSWEAHVSPVQGPTIAVPAVAGYKQYVVRAYKSQSDASSWNSNYVAERGIGVAQDGAAGKDGTDYEYIFRRTTVNSRPSTPETSQTDDYVPSGWTDNPQGISETYPYEWASMRTKNDKLWGPFCTPYPFCVLGKQGIQGINGAFPYDRGVYKSGQSYVWNETRRDKIIYLIGNTYYNFLVKVYGSTVTAAPTSANGDSNWEAMQKFESIVTDTFFADGANIAGLMFKLKGYNSAGVPYGEIQSQNTNDSGSPTLYMNTLTGLFHCEKAEITGEITATSGKIGGWSISGNNLQCSGYDTKINVEASGTRFMRINYSETEMCYIRADESKGLVVNVYGDTQDAIGISVRCNHTDAGADLNDFAIKSYGNVLLEARNNELIQIRGMCLNTVEVQSTYTLKSYDDVVWLRNSATITVPLAGSMPGKVFFIKQTGGNCTLTGSSFLASNSSTPSSSLTLSGTNMFFLVSVGTYWCLGYCG